MDDQDVGCFGALLMLIGAFLLWFTMTAMAVGFIVGVIYFTAHGEKEYWDNQNKINNVGAK